MQGPTASNGAAEAEHGEVADMLHPFLLTQRADKGNLKDSEPPLAEEDEAQDEAGQEVHRIEPLLHGDLLHLQCGICTV